VKSYFVKEGSDSQHDCCFEATVIYRPMGEGYKEYVVCECVDIDYAERIADLLSKEDAS
jgi:hypothetical protein